jgi:hypothetical protein
MIPNCLKKESSFSMQIFWREIIAAVYVMDPFDNNCWQENVS